MTPTGTGNGRQAEPGRDRGADWSARMTTLTRTWQTVTAEGLVDIQVWQQRLTMMKATQEQLQRLGRWTRGPADLMTVCGVHRRELAHSSALRWLCDASGSHGLGDAFLRRLLVAAGGDPGTTTDAEAVNEVSRETSRADLVVYGGDWTLVAELKIDAIESQRQCQRLYEDWRTEPGVRLAFITLSGRAPSTAGTAEAVQAWNCLSWAMILDAVDEAVRGTSTPEAPAVAEYRRTLRRLVRRR